MTTYAVIVDIDGTLADATHRMHLLPKGPLLDDVSPDEAWNRFFDAAGDDEPITEIITLVRALYRDNVIFLATGRRESNREVTVAWLERHKVSYDHLLMRPEGDTRRDDVVKREMLDEIRSHKLPILFALEDRSRVVSMWRANGIRTLQVAEGNY